jgi:hypothetical protein
MTGARALGVSRFVIALLLVSGSAEAAKVGVAPFTGSKPKGVHDQIVSVLEKDGHSVVAVKVSAKDDDETVRLSAEKAEVVAIVHGDTTMRKSGWTLTLVVRSAADGSVIAEPTIKAPWYPGLLKAIDKEAANEVAPALRSAEQALAAAEPEPEPEPEPEEEPEAEPEGEAEDADETDEVDPDAKSRGSAFSVFMGGGAFRRGFAYHQDVNRNLRGYDLPAAPVIVGGIEWYPGGHFTAGFAAAWGLILEAEQSIAARSETAGGTTFDTALRGFAGGLRFRQGFGDHQIGLSGKVGRQVFTISGDADPDATSASGVALERDLIPDVAYTYVRPGLDLRLRFGEVGFGLTAGYRAVLSMGDLTGDAWFPDASAQGIDVGLQGGYRLGGGVSILLGVDYRRYGIDMHSSPEDLDQGRDVAGGAVDQYCTGWLGLGWELDGVGAR